MEVVSGVLGEECGTVLKEFFRAKRLGAGIKDQGSETLL
jgi:hypothetical protein